MHNSLPAISHMDKHLFYMNTYITRAVTCACIATCDKLYPRQRLISQGRTMACHYTCTLYVYICISVLLKQINIVPNDHIMKCTVSDSCLEWGYAFSTCSLKQYFHTVPFFFTGPSSKF